MGNHDELSPGFTIISWLGGNNIFSNNKISDSRVKKRMNIQ